MIELFDGWCIGVDEHCYALQRHTNYKRKDGTEKLKTYGYYAGLSGALEAFSKELARQKHIEGCARLADALAAVRESEEAVKQYIGSETSEAIRRLIEEREAAKRDG